MVNIYTIENVKYFYFLKDVEIKVLVTIKLENTFILTIFFELVISFRIVILYQSSNAGISLARLNKNYFLCILHVILFRKNFFSCSNNADSF